MTSAEALAFLMDLFADVPAAGMWIYPAVDASRVADTNGLAPIDTGWVDTVDEWLAAAWVADRMALSEAMSPTADVLKQVNSEGTTLTVEPGRSVDWTQMASAFRSRSPLVSAPSGLGLIELNGTTPADIPRSWGLL